MVVELIKKHPNSKYPGNLDMVEAQNISREFLCTEAELSEIAEKYCLDKEDVFEAVKIYVSNRPDLKILYQNKMYEETSRFDSYESDAINDVTFRNHSFRNLIKYAAVEITTETIMSKAWKKNI